MYRPRFITVVFSLFQILCITITLSFIIYNVIVYSKNDDVTEVSYKMYTQDTESIYPAITICTSDAFSSEKLKEYGEGINETTYGNFLKVVSN